MKVSFKSVNTEVPKLQKTQCNHVLYDCNSKTYLMEIRINLLQIKRNCA